MLFLVISEFEMVTNPKFYWNSCEMNEQDVVNFVLTKKGCCNLRITIKDEGDENDRQFYGTLHINSQSFRKYLLEDKQSMDYIEIKNPNNQKHRTKLIEFAANFLRSVAGDFPNREEKIAMVNAMINLFPDLNRKGNDEFLKKCLGDRLKYVRRCIKEVSSSEIMCEAKSIEEIVPDTSTKNKLYFLQNADVTHDRLKIQQYLKDTLIYRIEESYKKEINILRKYKIFMLDPDLVGLKIIVQIFMYSSNSFNYRYS